jgi:cytochrome oxidase Cu insertion factor (SCO1/SenC/PrrC family)
MYAGIAVFAVLLIGTFSWLRAAQENREEVTMKNRIANNVGRAEKSEPMLTLEEDLVATNQEGEEVRFSELNDKVWIVAEFFADCPMCAARNGDHLMKFYERFRDNPDFHIVCVSVDPEKDDPEMLQKYAEALGAETENWWFLTGDREKLHGYMEEEMKFLPISERQNELEIESKGRFSHDMGLAVIGKDMKMLEKKDLFFARSQGGPELYAHFEKQLMDAVEKGLAQGNDE